MSRTFGITRFYQSSGIAPHEEKHYSIAPLMSSVRSTDQPAKYFTFSPENSLLIKEAIQRKRESITVEQLFLEFMERLVINLIDFTIIRYTRSEFTFSDIICTLVEQVNDEWTSLQNPEWPFHVVIYDYEKRNDSSYSNRNQFTIHHVRIENNRVFCSEGIVIIKYLHNLRDTHNPVDILRIGRQNHNERRDANVHIKMIPYGQIYYRDFGLIHSYPQSAVATVKKPENFAEFENIETIDEMPVKVIDKRVFSEKGVYSLVPKHRYDHIKGIDVNDQRLLDAEYILKIVQIKKMIDNGLDDFVNLDVRFRIVEYNRPFVIHDHPIYLDRYTVYTSQPMKKVVEEFQKVIYEELMEKTHHPDRVVKWCLDEDTRTRCSSTFDMSQPSGSLDQ